MSSTSTRAYYGSSAANVAAIGAGGFASPMVDSVLLVESGAVSILSSALAKNARVVIRPYGGGKQLRGVNSEFSMAKWKAKVSTLTAQIPSAQMHNFVQQGTVAGILLIDDFKSGSVVFPGGVPDFEDLEEMASYVKSWWTSIPTSARAENQYLKTLAVNAGASNYTHLDYGWAQWYHFRGNVQTWYTNHVNSGREFKLGAMAGAAVLDGGSGLTAPWNVNIKNSTLGDGMSPQEITACANAFSALTTLIGFEFWSADPFFDVVDYWHVPSIQTSLDYLASKAVGRLQGPFNWRDISGSTSGSTQTVGGSWAYTSGGQYRAGGTFVNVPLPSSRPAGTMLGLLVYSRDSGLSAQQPSGWSTAAAISGSSAQGGQLTLFYRLVNGGETSPTVVSFSGTADGDSATMGRSFGFSGNTTKSQAAMLSTVGSVKSWAGGTSNWGPIKGVTSAISDALVLICAGRTNDFNNGDPPPDATLSTTTSDGETWNRGFLVTHLSGDHAAMFMDYAFLSGTPSITTKSWTALSGSGSASSGPGCGFMATFAPFSIVGGTPPAIEPPIVVDPDDVTMSVASHLSFTLSSTGSTPITWSLTSGPSNITLGSSTGAFEWSPLSVGTFVILVTATNSFGSDSAGFTVVTVSSGGTSGGGSGAGNTAPTITHPGNKTVAAHDLLSFLIAASDAESDQITFRLESSAPAGSFIDSVTGQFIWIPSGEQGPGTYPVVVLVSDGQAESRSTFTVTVNDTIWTREGGPSTQLGRTSPVLNSFTRIL